jgi:DNA polymerase III subunit alpha
MKFANLHHHTTFSYGDGYGTPAQHVTRAAELGYTCIAATEHGNVSSHVQLEKAALKAGIKPIFGIEGYCGPIDEEHRSQWKNHLTIIAENLDGYRSLMRVVTQSWRDYYYHPTISGSSLAENRDGLIILSGCSGSLLACSLLGGKGIPEPEGKFDWDAARDVASRFAKTFGDNYFLEIQPFYELERTCDINGAYVQLGRELGIPLVVTNDVHYPCMDDAEMQAILHASHRGNQSVDDAMRSWNYEVPLTLPERVTDLRTRLVKTGMSPIQAADAIATSMEIAERCNVTLPKAERLRYPIQEDDLRPWS